MTRIQAYEAFLQELVSAHSHALTVTLRKDSTTESMQNRRLRLQETIHHLLYRTTRMCFKNRHKRHNLQIGAAVVIEAGRCLGRPHAHLSLACPLGMPHSEFEQVVRSAVSKCLSLSTRQFVLKPITNSSGWASYMAKEGPEAFVPECTQRAKA
jgi:hypothetical protein